MKKIIVLAALMLLATSAFPQSETKGSATIVRSTSDEFTVLAIGQVPSDIMAVAGNAAPDVYFTQAQRYLRSDFVEYRLTGRLFREEWQVHVREDGKLLRVESDNQADR
ncbi:MAG: hypothetical protein AAGG55_14530 [Pseudomonadota bacterium]